MSNPLPEGPAMSTYAWLALCAVVLAPWIWRYVRAVLVKRGAGPDDMPRIRALNRETERLIDRGQLDWALQVAEDTFRRAECALGGGDPAAWEARELLGACLYGMGRAGEALAHHEAVLERRVADPLDRFAWMTRNNVAVCCMDLGFESNALRHLQSAEREMCAVVKADDQRAIAVRVNLAYCLARLGRADESLRVVDSSLQAWEERFAAHQARPRESSTLNGASVDPGKLRKAIASASEKGPRSAIPSVIVLAGDERLVVGPSAVEMTAAMESLFLGEDGLTARWLSVWTAQLTACKAFCLMRADRPADALPLYRSALYRSERLLGYEHPYTHQCRNQLGECLMSLEEWETALGYLNCALTEQCVVLGSEHLSSVGMRINRATTLEHLDELADALSDWVQVARSLAANPQPGGVWLKNLVGTYRALDRHSRAARLSEWPELFAGLREALAEVMDLLDPEQWAVARDAVAGFHAIYLGLCVDLERVELVPRALAGVQGRKLAALVLEELDRRAEVEGPESLARRYHEVRVRLRQLALGLRVVVGGRAEPGAEGERTAAAEAGHAREQVAAYKAGLAEYRVLRDQVAAAYPYFMGPVRSFNPSLTELQSALGLATALVLLMLRRDQSAAGSVVALVILPASAALVPLGTWAVTPVAAPAEAGRGVGPAVRLSRRGLRLAVREGFCQQAEESAGEADVEEARQWAGIGEPWATWLGSRFWRPLSPHLDGVDTLHLVTQGALHGLPYEAGRPPTLNLATYPGLVYYDRLRRASEGTLRPEGRLAFRAYGAEETRCAIPLVQVEPRVLRSLWPAGDATEDRGGDEVGVSCLHLAGHGLFDPRDPTLARVWLGPGEALGFHEVMAMRSVPPVVFLSACVVGRTAEDPLEGDPLGLVGALFLRGARYCIGSLQPIQDLYMPILVTLFYQGWCTQGLPPSRALAEARSRLHTGNWYPETEALLRNTYPPVLDDWLERVAREGSDAALCLLASDWYPDLLSPALNQKLSALEYYCAAALADPAARSEIARVRGLFADSGKRAEAVHELMDCLVPSRAALQVEDLVTWVCGFGLGH